MAFYKPGLRCASHSNLYTATHTGTYALVTIVCASA